MRYKAIIVLWSFLVVFPAVITGEDGLPIMKLSELKPGMKGYGLTVFKGTKIEKFNVEIISILKKGFANHQDAILVKCDHKVTDHAKIIHGMSGSPVFIDGKVIGAMAFYFQKFQKDPIGGVTPIEYMLQQWEKPQEEVSIDKTTKFAMKEPSQFNWIKMPLTISPSLPFSLPKEIEEEFDKIGFKLVSGGGSGGTIEEEHANVALEPGSSVGLYFLKGDIEMSGGGTVTYKKDNKVLVFGHPMSLSGPISMPMTTAYVHEIIATDLGSFKLMSPIKEVGSFTFDQLPAVGGVIGKKCDKMVPLTINVKNLNTDFKKQYNCEMLDYGDTAPQLLLLGSLYGLMFAEPTGNIPSTVFYKCELSFKDGKTVLLEDVTDNIMNFFDPDSLFGSIMKIYSNPFQTVSLKQANIELALKRKRLTATIVSAWLDEVEAKPGDEIGITVALKPFNEQPVKKHMKLKVPFNMFPGDYEVTVSGGKEAFFAPVPESLDDILRGLKKRYKRNTLAVVMKVPSLGISSKGRLMPQLPISVFGTLLTNTSAELAIEQDTVTVLENTDYIVSGKRTLVLRVKK